MLLSGFGFGHIRGMLPSDLILSALRFILSAKSRQSCKQDFKPVDFCNSLEMATKKMGDPLGSPVTVHWYEIRVTRSNEMSVGSL